jgi:hypothetical protein
MNSRMAMERGSGAGLIYCLLVACSSSSMTSGTAGPDASRSGTSESGGDGAAASQVECHWPAGLNDGGPGACHVGRAYVECAYSEGVTCEDGTGAFSPDGVTELCLSNDGRSCSGCRSTTGTAACASKCAVNEYAVSCGGPPRPTPDGGSASEYQSAPTGCIAIGSTPGGNTYSCCPCL